ncbi:hypothetical protein KFU94_21905, partial [Chloroflexi bacterium TSY]|nr:hypothetical protein [Chloroflexi bacterium TSY]
LRPDFPGGVFWGDLNLHQGGVETILRSWGAFCGVDLSQEADVHVMSERVRAGLAQRCANEGSILAVLDDLRSDWMAAAQLLFQTLPAKTPLLLTTRRRELAARFKAKTIRLDVLPIDDARDLLRSWVVDQSILSPPELVDGLLDALGYLPLAIELAGAYLSTEAGEWEFPLAPLWKRCKSGRWRWRS